MEDLKERAIRGGFAKVVGQGANFVLRLAAIMVLSRLLQPEDFGLFAMVTAFTGVYYLFTSAGLSTATVQQPSISDDQISKLFWVNSFVGILLGLLCMAMAPLVVGFYHEPRLFWITVVLGIGFAVTGLGVQHSAILERRMRYVTLAAIEIVAQATSVVVGVAMALAGFGYWSLVGATIAAPISYTAGVWIATGWIPHIPPKAARVGGLLRFGGTVTLNNLVVYVAYNLDKVLLGRFVGVDALGLYSRAYQIVNIPTANINAAVNGIAFSALARLQDDPVRMRSSFLKGYALVNSLTIPITVCFGLYAYDIVLVVLGTKWVDAALIFMLLTPTILAFGIINPTGWLLVALGLQVRSMCIGLVIAPLVIAAYTLGLPFGAKGVAFGFSAAMTLWIVPHVYWSLHGTGVTPRDIAKALMPPIVSAVVGGVAAIPLQLYGERFGSPLLRLCLEAGAMVAIYILTLLFVMKQKSLYTELFASLGRKPRYGATVAASSVKRSGE